MALYEYKTFDLPLPKVLSGDSAAMDVVLNRAAGEGWELVTVTVLAPGTLRAQTVAFMRRSRDR